MTTLHHLTATERANRCVLPLAVACHRATADQRGSIGAIAEIHGWNYNTLALQLNPARDSHTLPPDVIEAVLAYTQDGRILDSMCAAHGNAAWFELPASDDADLQCLLAGYGDIARQMGELGGSLSQAIIDRHINQDELAELQKLTQRLIGASQRLIRQARAVVNHGE